MSSKDRFYKDSLTLTISNLVTGILGFMFSIILSRELGAEGMGLYGLVMPIYNLFLCLICGGMVTAISKVSSVFLGKNDYNNLNKSIKTALFFDFCWSLLVATFVFIASPFISSSVIKDSRTLYSIMAVCPALIFVALSSILKGYFYGISKVEIPAFIDIVEKAIRIAVLVSTINIFCLKTVNNTVMASYFALCAGELISLAFLFIFYKINNSSFYKGISFSYERRTQLLFDILFISFPLCINGFLSTALSTVSTIIVPRRLISAGFTYSNSLSLIGKFTGMSLNVIFFPIIVVQSMSTILVPDLSKSLSKNDFFSMEGRISEVIKVSFLLGVCTMLICITIPFSLGMLFFSRNDLGIYIKFAALSAPFSYTASCTYAILNGLGKQGVLLKNSLIVSVEELILLFIFTGIPSINIFGYGISLILTSITLFILNFYEIRKTCYIHYKFSELLIYFLLSIFIYLILGIANRLLPNSYFAVKTIILITLGFALFFIGVKYINKTLKDE